MELVDRLTPRERLWIQATADDSRGFREQAAAGYESYLAQYPDDSRAWFRVGWTCMAGLGEYDGAIAAFERVIVLNPRDGAAHVNLATSLSGAGRFDDAVTTYRKAFDLDPSLKEALFVNHEYGVTLMRVGDLEEATAVYRSAIDSADLSRKARGYRSMALLDMYRGRYDDAVHGLRQAVMLNQRLSSISEFRDRLFLADALWAKRRTRAAGDTEFNQARALADRLALGPEWLYRVAQAQAQRRNLTDAKRLLAAMGKTAHDATSDSSTNRNAVDDTGHLDLVRGEIALAEGRIADAIRVLETVSVADRRDVAGEPLARAYAAAGRFADAIKRYEDLTTGRPPLGIEAQGTWLSTHLHLGTLYERTGRPADARRLYQRLAELWKDADPDLDLLIEIKKRLRR